MTSVSADYLSLGLMTLVGILFPLSAFILNRFFRPMPDPNDPTNNCLDVAIITAPEKRTKKTIEKLNTIAGRVLKK